MTEALEGDLPHDRDDRRLRSGSRALAGVYFTLAILGGIGTWFFNLRFGAGSGVDDGGGGIQGYLGGWFANDSASSAAVDLIVMTVAASVVYWRERWVLPGRLPWALLFIPLSLAVAVSFAFPLFLGLRELALRQRTRTRGAPHGSSPTETVVSE